MILRCKRGLFDDPPKHYFNRELARRYGIHAALLLNKLGAHIKSIKTRRKDKAGWYFITLEDLAACYGYMSLLTVKRTMSTLRKDGVLKADRFNRRKGDRTLWYSFALADDMKLAVSNKDMISFVESEATAYGILPAILMSNLRYGSKQRDWIKVAPAEMSDYLGLTDIGSQASVSPYSIRYALKSLVGRELERRRMIDGACEYHVMNLYGGRFECKELQED